VRHSGTVALSSREIELFEGLRGRLEAIAYRLLGSAGDAEDAVQDTFLRWRAADRNQIETPEAWLTKALTNVCLNRLTSARARRETYVGQWLPEPLLAGDRMLGPAETAEQRESVSLAVLTLMERLSPQERAVYVLREAFAYPHGEIAEILDITETNSQQIYRRARQHVATDRVRMKTDAAAAERIAEEFLAAARSGAVEPLLKLLTDDAISIGDGGGRIPTRRTPLVGALGVARFLRSLFTPTTGTRTLIRTLTGGRPAIHATVVNGGPGLLVVVGDRVVGVMSLDVTSDGVATVHVQANPDKLDRVTRQWAASEHGRPLVDGW
jgi:RNA polymerase sigma factor (sigma-70 family)